MSYSYTLTQDLNWQSQADWQQPDTPFMSFAYWQALNDTGAIGQQSGWVPLYIVIYQDETQPPIAALPVFIKGHHQGEYVFDHAWADAYMRYGVDYYPRLVTSVPYTPVSGHRFWLAKGESLSPELWQVALTAVDAVAKQTGASSWHGLFINDEQQQVFNSLPNPLFEHQLLEREGCQFLWQNQKLTDLDPQGRPKPFSDFDDFLSTLTAKKRKNIRAERKKIAKQQLTCQIKTGEQISKQDWEVFYQCYAMTYAVRGRHPYLSPEFFEQIAQTMPEHLMLAQGLDESGEVIASSLFFYDDPSQPEATLYGRYWGSLEEYDSLHFELCYYQGIEFAIAKGLQYFDPGTQGEHKLIRGFVPQKTHSLHRIYDARFEPAIANFCEQDRQYMQQYRQQAHEALPFNIDNMPKFSG
ncbi:GNAT family N-acetyltransferase [Psychrobacter sp. FDAARGOS_221]|uniref:GNAT family N-acetyltransferase n=1 Tax=Psychrobacter sp. FDAARGOS_221 TaxID=1975705 RepID=UPI000BB57ABE|nr:GNAT family N-acetyltransferase [Psychrobacter sp. FDAARGOS_221]PNK61074.1 GNAT family N-acetyltransferase [Psychrobacter sp. FDAARGOS_221]